jgi:hypothetical protein
VFEVLLSAVIVYLFFQRSYKPSSRQEKPLTVKVLQAFHTTAADADTISAFC